jgi:hypothetical protein
MSTRVITPDAISFTDNMYEDHWVIIKEMYEDDKIYSLKRKKNQGRNYRYLGSESEILNVLATVELTLWEESSKRKPNMKHIPFSYIIHTADRYGVNEMDLPSTFDMEQIKIFENDEE